MTISIDNLKWRAQMGRQDGVMGREIERKFLLKDESWRDGIESQCDLRQGYLSAGQNSSVRVRVAGDQAYLNIKSRTVGIVRSEFEYLIPLTDAEEILESLTEGPLIEKTRYLVPHEGHMWEIDVFSGNNQGLVVAEVELQSEHETITKPAWLGKEVSDDVRYYNAALVNNPYGDWPEASVDS